ncbi:hypothetical protein AB4Z09_14870 [Rhodococcus sp. TAF43]|uniref:hypothetical protein n=1 Tax=Rhodococcus sp. W8901 TaxID=2742603 RepID=UPI0015815024|nr:hypothetical protein [Rhodococcus sp. W8901]QKT11933.1 hypothetical protein HUN07_15510 [Rhodococcus sp. W8901]
MARAAPCGPLLSPIMSSVERFQTRTAVRRAAMHVGLTIAGGLSPLLLAGCTSGGTTPAPSASETESAAVDTTTGSDGCDVVPKQRDELYGKEWLLAYKQEPSSGVSLRRCHYSRSAQDRTDLVHPASGIADADEVQEIILSLPDSTDVGHRCGPGGDYVFIYTFDEYTVLDQSGTPVATFQTSENGPCGINNVIPSA